MNCVVSKIRNVICGLHEKRKEYKHLCDYLCFMKVCKTNINKTNKMGNAVKGVKRKKKWHNSESTETKYSKVKFQIWIKE